MIDCPNKHKNMVMYCLRHKMELPSRDVDEIEGIQARLLQGFELTAGQITHLNRIYEEIKP